MSFAVIQQSGTGGGALPAPRSDELATAFQSSSLHTSVQSDVFGDIGVNVYPVILQYSVCTQESSQSAMKRAGFLVIAWMIITVDSQSKALHMRLVFGVILRCSHSSTLCDGFSGASGKAR